MRVRERDVSMPGLGGLDVFGVRVVAVQVLRIPAVVARARLPRMGGVERACGGIDVEGPSGQGRTQALSAASLVPRPLLLQRPI